MKKVILVIALLLIGFIKINVYAYNTFPDPNNIEFTINGSTSTTNNKVYTSTGNVTFKLASDEIFIPTYNSATQIKYGYISVCVSNKFNLTTYTTGNFTRNFKPIFTNVPCTIYNTSAYPYATTLYMTFQLNIDGAMCKTGASSTLCSLDNGMTIYSPQANEWTLNSYGFSTDPFEVDSATGSLINQNTTIINQNNQMINKIDSMVSSQNQTNNILNQNHTYNKNASETINGQSDINNQTQAEDNLMNSLDFSGANNLDISINADSSNFIWSIVERLRLLPKITLFMTSVLGLGIIKMILNR